MTLGAASGPLLVTVRVHVSWVPAIAGSGEWVLLMARSACGRWIFQTPSPWLPTYAVPWLRVSKKKLRTRGTCCEPGSWLHDAPPSYEAKIPENCVPARMVFEAGSKL